MIKRDGQIVMAYEQLKEQVAAFPASPGVYIMRDEAGRRLYIGKAVNLRSRVRSYVAEDGEGDGRYQIPALMRKVAQIEWIATNTETEALILEANLIRIHKPPYNIDLRDDKHYPYVKITLNEPFPRLLVVRRVESDGARYFGPYTDVTAMRRAVDFAMKFFRLRDCSLALPPSKPVRPCINYSMGKCSGACAGKISEHNYRIQIAMLIDLFAGRRTEIIKILTEQMQTAAESLDFEEAGKLRDRISTIRSLGTTQTVDLKTADVDLDAFGIYSDEHHLCLCVLSFRDGILFTKRHFTVKSQGENLDRDGLDTLLLRFYQSVTDDPPPLVLLPADAGFSPELIGNWLSEKIGRKVEVSVPQRGSKTDFVELANRNARLQLIKKVVPLELHGVKELQEALSLPRPPEVIEAFDISNLGESFTVAGMVRFVGGTPDKSGYRRFKIKGVDGQNDFAMMMEAVTRRLTRLEREGKPFPDLLLIDGGKGQLSSAMKALEGFANPPMIASLAKQEEILFSPHCDGPVTLPQTHPARRLVERVRNEVHRFAITYHRTIRGKQFTGSVLETMPGIGKTKAATLLKHFGSVKRIREAEVDEIASVAKVKSEVAEEILGLLKGLAKERGQS